MKKAITITNKNISKILKRTIKILRERKPDDTIFCMNCGFFHGKDHKCSNVIMK